MGADTRRRRRPRVRSRRRSGASTGRPRVGNLGEGGACGQLTGMLPRALTHAVGMVGLFAALSCDFFEELESAESATSGSGSDGTESAATGTAGSTGDGPCTLEADDRCTHQDELAQCSPQTGEVERFDCGSLCGSFVNFSCVLTGTGQHGCWCVEPGAQKVLSCSELEACLQGCVGDLGSACADQCFSRTTASTIRMYGALVHCAHDTCHEPCWDMPESCGACIDDAIARGGQGCGFERSVCDSDRNDEPFG